MYNKNIAKAIEEISKYKNLDVQQKALQDLLTKYGAKTETIKTLSNGIKLFRVIDKDGKTITEYHAASPQWGGARKGAGAKKQAPEGATRRTFLLTNEEHQKVKEYIAQLRS